MTLLPNERYLAGVETEKRHLQEEVDELELLTRPGREEDLRTFLLLLHPADVADLITDVDERTSAAILRHLDPNRAATLVAELDPAHQERVLSAVSPKDLAPIVGQMETDDITDLLQELPEARARDLLARLPTEERKEVTELLRYDPESAGGLMQSELVSVNVEATIAQAIDAAREAASRVDLLCLYVVDHDHKYLGDLALQDLVLNAPTTKVLEVMTPPVATVTTDLDQEKVAQIFDRYSLVEVGVVDLDGRLRGRITADDIHEVLVEEAEEDMLLMAGAGDAPDLLQSGKVLRVAGARLPWLLSTFIAGLIASLILQRAQLLFGNMVVLLTFVPVITGMSGNVGTQSAMIMIRAMAVGHIDPKNIGKSVARDVVVGAMMALVCGSLVLVLVTVWEDFRLALCVSISLFCSMVTASVLGSTEPALLKRLGIDPAIAAGPLITSINDISGVTIYAAVASVVLGATTN